MSSECIIVIGGSAGSVEAVRELVGYLPPDLPAALLVVIHFPSYSVSYLPEILNRLETLPAHLARDGEPLLPGAIYVAVPDYHLTVQNDTIRLTRDARENHCRPSIDYLFRTAAHAHGSNVIGVILSGMLNDGTAGMIQVKRAGGIALVQEPSTASFADMPRSVLLNMTDVDAVLPLPELAAHLVQLVGRATGRALVAAEVPSAPAPEPVPKPALLLAPAAGTDEPVSEEDRLSGEIVAPIEMVEKDTRAQLAGARNGQPSIYSCPDCGGVLWQSDESDFLHFRCHVGHAFAGEILLQQQSEVLESSIWYALRTLIDKAKLARQLANRARERGHEKSVAQFEEQERTAFHHARVIRDLITRSDDVALTHLADDAVVFQAHAAQR